ncbi:HU family DNA-binding protein [Hydrogenobaculum acidophilum]
MTKRELVSYVAEQTGIPKAKAEKCINAVFEAISKSLKKKEKTIIPGFGTFTVATRKERKGRNPKTGQEIKIPKRTIAVWRASKELKNIK